VITLYVVPGSNASMTARLMLEHKDLAYRRVDLLPTLHGPLLRLFGFRGLAVPAMKLNGRRIQGSLDVARALEQWCPQPSLFPEEPNDRMRVETIERWGESVLQELARRLAWWALSHERSALRSFSDGARLHIPLCVAMCLARPVVRHELRAHHATDVQVSSDLRRLPGLLDELDAWIRDGVIGRPDLTAADFQVAPSVRLLMCSEQLAPTIAARECGRLALRVAGTFPGHLPWAFPTDWLAVTDKKP
jgi:glutathione S-transferase